MQPNKCRRLAVLVIVAASLLSLPASPVMADVNTGAPDSDPSIIEIIIDFIVDIFDQDDTTTSSLRGQISLDG